MKGKQKLIATDSTWNAQLHFLDWLQSALVTGGMRAVQELLPEKHQLPRAVLENLIESFERPVNEKFEEADTRSKELRAKQPELLEKVKDEESALTALLLL